MKWEYGEIYKKYDMSGKIKVGTGVVQVHDIFEKTPEFMLEADAVFVDPPYNQSALSSYYTKADIKLPKSFADFKVRLLEVINEIKPKIVFLESGKKQSKEWTGQLREMFDNVTARDSYYCHSRKNVCDIICACNGEIPECIENLPLMDEQKVIQLICQSVDFDCIADPCMGRGLVAYYADMYGRKFVGTELNPKRLAVCIERVKNKKL